MRRVVVIGTTGSGKSTLAERLSEQTGLRVVELDALFWGRDWQGAPVELFRHRVERETRDDGWIVVGNYSQVRDLVWRPADTLVWLDLPLSLVMWRLVRRTVRRVTTREDLWGTGNREILASIPSSAVSRSSCGRSRRTVATARNSRWNANSWPRRSGSCASRARARLSAS